VKLSNNFVLDEFLRSQTAARNDIDMTPSIEVLANIQKLVTEVLQPIREAVDSPIFISSGYRPLALNVMIGGAKTSAHIDGRAADFVVRGMTPYAVSEVIQGMDIPFDKNILEFQSWTHIAISDANRKQTLTAYRENGVVQYKAGLFA
jgi:zinc D-Ala-D-Ala carboxypeptidase